MKDQDQTKESAEVQDSDQSEPSETKDAEESETSSKSVSKSKKDKVLYFKLNTGMGAFWAPDDRSIILSLPQAAEHGIRHIYGSLTDKSKVSYDYAERAINRGILLEVSKKEYETNKDSTDKVPSMSLNAKIEEQFVMDRKVESILRQAGDSGEKKILEYIDRQEDVTVLTNMIKIEEIGKKRKKILQALDVAIRRTKSSGMSQLTEEGTGNEYSFSGKQIRKETPKSK